MSEELALLIVQVLVKYGPEVALDFANLFKKGATIDDAINALIKANAKTAQQYLAAAKV